MPIYRRLDRTVPPSRAVMIWPDKCVQTDAWCYTICTLSARGIKVELTCQHLCLGSNRTRQCTKDSKHQRQLLAKLGEVMLWTVLNLETSLVAYWSWFSRHCDVTALLIRSNLYTCVVHLMFSWSSPRFLSSTACGVTSEVRTNLHWVEWSFGMNFWPLISSLCWLSPQNLKD